MSNYSIEGILLESHDCAKELVKNSNLHERNEMYRAMQLAHHIVCKFDVRGTSPMIDDITRVLFSVGQEIGGVK